MSVGFLGNATYPDGTGVASVAALNEFGVPSRNQPPRPFFRGMIAEKHGEWGDATATALKANNFDATRTLDQIGAAVAGQLRQAIASSARLSARGHASGSERGVGGNSFADGKVGLDDGEPAYETFLPGALAAGRYTAAPLPLVVGQGLDRIPEALQRQRTGVSTAKLVVTP